jgi:predicted ATP-grasp superfamily ATP-dependent carboligase
MDARILVTGSGTFFAARLIHDLGRRGAIITAADSLRISAGKTSRFVSHRLRLPVLGTDPGGYLEAVLDELRRRPYDLLLPMFEESLLLSEYQAEIRSHARMFLPAFSSMLRLHHKPSLDGLCTSLGLPTPPTLVLRNPGDLRLVPQSLGFPVVLKLPAGNNAVGRTYCDDEATLEREFSRLAEQQASRSGELPFVQKKIDGEMICTLCFCWQGRKLAEVVYRSSRTFPESGGTAAHRESIHHPQISQIADRLVAATRWSGFLGLDFLLENDTGIPYVIDANTRANPAIHLGFLCGLDWSKLIFDLLAGETPAVQTARAGVHAHNLLTDVTWLLEGLLPRTGSLWRFPQRCARFLFPRWPVHSRDDLIGIGEIVSAAVVGSQAVYSLGKSIVSGQQPGEVLLENANYNPATAAVYRTTREEARRQRRAA